MTKAVAYMLNDEIDQATSYEVMGWKEGKGLAGGGCRPADAKPTPKIPEFEPGTSRRKLYGGCEMGSRGGTFPYVFYGTLFRSKGGGGEFWKPTERLEQAMEVAMAMKDHFKIERDKDGRGTFYKVHFGDTMAQGRTLSAVICKAALQHIRHGKKNGKSRKA